MDRGKWKNPVLEMASDARGCYVSLWTGYRWEYFAGPFENEREAKVAVDEWVMEFFHCSRPQFNFEMLDGQK